MEASRYSRSIASRTAALTVVIVVGAAAVSAAQGVSVSGLTRTVCETGARRGDADGPTIIAAYVDSQSRHLQAIPFQPVCL